MFLIGGSVSSLRDTLTFLLIQSLGTIICPLVYGVSITSNNSINCERSHTLNSQLTFFVSLTPFGPTMFQKLNYKLILLIHYWNNWPKLAPRQNYYFHFGFLVPPPRILLNLQSELKL